MWELPLLGAAAAACVYLGMPVARSAHLSVSSRTALTGGTLGILAYIIFDLTLSAREQLVASLPIATVRDSAMLLLFGVGLGIGWLVLPFGQWYVNRRDRIPAAAAVPRAGAPSMRLATVPTRSLLGLSTVTAAGIGLHSFAEGMALGAAYATGIATLTLLLGGAIIVHKSTEGYCICGCDPATARTYSKTQLGLLGLLGGGPTFVGTEFGGYVGATPIVSVLVYGLAIGAITAVLWMIFDRQRRLHAASRIAAYGVAGFAIAFWIGVLLAPAGL